MTSTTDTNDFIKWDIWVAKVWYDDHSGWKNRPVMILDGSRFQILPHGVLRSGCGQIDNVSLA
jgi:hypothetical protein